MFGLRPRRTARILVLLAMAAALAGCGTPVFNPFAAQTNSNQANALNIVSIIGAPDTVGMTLLTQMQSSATARNLPMTTGPAVTGGRNISGYLSAITETDGTTLSYVWDVFDADGNRIHRIEGSEKSAERPSDPWIAANEAVLGRVAETSTAALATWLIANGQNQAVPEETTPTQTTPTQTAPAPTAAETPPATGTISPPSTGGTASPANQSGDASPATNGAMPVRSAAFSADTAPRPGLASLFTGTTGSRAQTAALSASQSAHVQLSEINGARGNGDTALAEALSTALAARGVRTHGGDDAPYRIFADVTQSPAHNGLEAIALIWRVEDRAGNVVGTVRQLRHVAAGTLGGEWGSAAVAAAEAAAGGIVELINDPAQILAQR
ncbi:MAG: hypothetical protein MI753_06330 [Hyphomicrobiales bacterium]|nr:hypothetical protein [Hyphomicrobiales bacterium]